MSMPPAPVRPKDVLPRVVVHDEAIEIARNDFTVTKRVPVTPSFLPFAMEGSEFDSKLGSPSPRYMGEDFVNHGRRCKLLQLLIVVSWAQRGTKHCDICTIGERFLDHRGVFIGVTVMPPAREESE